MIMEYKGLIYKLMSPNKKCYIGQTINLKKRMSEYKTFHHCENQRKLFEALKKYGFENFTLEILEEVNVDTQSELKEELNRLEVYYIEKYNSTTIGYNICRGGNQHRLGVKETLEQKQKKKDKWTLQRRVEQSFKMRGLKNPRFGKKFGRSCHAKYVDQFDLNGNFIQTFESITEASQKVLSTANKKIYMQNIAKVVRGELKTTGGFIWKLLVK